ARIAEVFALLPQIKRELPEAVLPMERPRVLAAMAASAAVLQALRRAQLRPSAREVLSGVLSLAPAALALRGGELAAYHGAEHMSIGAYEHGEARPKEHERCGSHLVGPLLLATAAGNIAAERTPPSVRPAARAAAAVGALARPGHELQHRLGTEEPTEAQLEVAEAALQACLELEQR